MRFLYVAARYHTNQVPIMEGLVKQGNEVMFISQFAGQTEDYSCVTPLVLGYSRLTDFIWDIIRIIKKWPKDQLGFKKVKTGLPPLLKLYRNIRDFRPDIAILCERSVYTIFANLICRWIRITTILYNQSPLWEGNLRNDLPHRLVRSLVPSKRITPVLGLPGAGKAIEPNAYYVPFVMPLMLAPEKKQYSKDNALRIFCVGKYEKRKNHLMLLEIINELNLNAKQKIYLTIAGELKTEKNYDYYREVQQFVTDNQLNDKVVLHKNLSRAMIFCEYEKADFFVLPSTLEPASISQLEAMAHSLPVICSDTNGTACYIENGENGYIFADNQKEALKRAIKMICDNAGRIPEMGAASYRIIEEKCSFQSYLEIVKIISGIVGDDLCAR
ncbi:MAG: glycosyltransferase family 4 protein [Lachnospiraceae bacterium]|nr:glycosyltransferase family 4 protein [Lachnospiraceae bacterium]